MPNRPLHEAKINLNKIIVFCASIRLLASFRKDNLMKNDKFFITNYEIIKSLTVIRFIAAYIVLISHTFGERSLGLQYIGAISVQLFFVLSGFVMYLNYADKIKKQHISFKKFMLMRTFRLYPIYFLTITLNLLLLLFGKSDPFKLLLLWIIDLVMLQSWSMNMNIAFNRINAPSWSVSNEMFFYLAFFVIVANLSNKKLFFCFIFYSCLWLFLISSFNGNPHIPHKWLWYVNPLFRLCDFFAGFFVGYLFVKNPPLIKYLALAKLNIFTISMLEICLVIILFASQFILPLELYWWVTIKTQLIAAALIYIIALNQGILAKFLSIKIMVLLGEASYSLYLIHYTILSIIIPKLSLLLWGDRLTFTTQLMINASKLTIPVLLSILLYKFYEAPIYKSLKSKIS